MEKTPMAKIIRLSSKSLTQEDIWKNILEINIQAIYNLIESNDLDKWEFLLNNFQSSIEDVKGLAYNWIDSFRTEQNREYISKTFLKRLPLRWLNTFKTTLYIMEEDLIQHSSEGVYNLWNTFFEIEEDRNLNYSINLNLKTVYHGKSN